MSVCIYSLLNSSQLQTALSVTAGHTVKCLLRAHRGPLSQHSNIWRRVKFILQYDCQVNAYKLKFLRLFRKDTEKCRTSACGENTLQIPSDTTDFSSLQRFRKSVSAEYFGTVV